MFSLCTSSALCYSLRFVSNMVCDLQRLLSVHGSFDVDFFEKFDVVVISCCSFAAKNSVNEKWRKLSKRVSFYTVDCRDSCGEIFVDLQKYEYAK
ncbi:hypothetical protein L1987_45993 [Smallanthus sonchifolius]|uniref:Uncharacterized protein n=1 Tax=Smallanthus sonchifolius TaxID=185202 RepID=A0ACB9FYP0_9ASTR|nr:hypothetical protein L1987_45993 [Smallanthus sonchifolius]